MITDQRPFDLAKGEAALAVRALPRHASPPEYLVGRRLAPIVCVNYVARAHAERLDLTRGGARWPAFDDLRLLDALVRTGSYPHLPTWGSFSTLRLLVRAASAGLGLAILPAFVVDAEPGLSRVLEPDARHVGNLWLLNHADLRENARVQAVRDVIREGFVARRERVEGWSKQGPEVRDPAP